MAKDPRDFGRTIPPVSPPNPQTPPAPEPPEPDQQAESVGELEDVEDLRKLTPDQLIALLQKARTQALMADEEMQKVRATTQAAQMMTSNVQEVYSRTVKVEKTFNRYDPKLRKNVTVTEDVDEDLYFYRVELPASAGEGLTINGMPLYHGMTVELDIDSLRTVKDMVARAYYHEASIFGQANDNAFRQGYMANGSRLNTTWSMRGSGGWAGARG